MIWSAAASTSRGVVVPWHQPLSVALSLFLVVCCIAFLATFRPRLHRDLVAGAVVWLALALVAWALPTLYRAWLTDLPPARFTGGWHALSTLAGRGMASVAVGHILVWQVRERVRRRRRRRRRLAASSDEQLTPEDPAP